MNSNPKIIQSVAEPNAVFNQKPVTAAKKNTSKSASAFKSLFQKLKFFDTFGCTVQFTLDGEDTFKTFGGLFVSVFYYFFLAWISMIYIYQFVYNKNPSAYTSVQREVLTKQNPIKLANLPTVFYMYDYGYNKWWTLEDINCHFHASIYKRDICSFYPDLAQRTIKYVFFKDKCDISKFSTSFQNMTNQNAKKSIDKWKLFCIDYDKFEDSEMELYGNPRDCLSNKNQSWYMMEWHRKADTSTCNVHDFTYSYLYFSFGTVTPNVNNFDNPWSIFENTESIIVQ